MNNTYNYSYLLNVESKEPAQHFAFEKGGTVIQPKLVEPEISKVNSIKQIFKKIFFPKNLILGK